MLVLDRKVGQSIMIGEGIEVCLLTIGEKIVRIGIGASKDIMIWRKELKMIKMDEDKRKIKKDG